MIVILLFVFTYVNHNYMKRNTNQMNTVLVISSVSISQSCYSVKYSKLIANS